jgi:hypothetical protein
MGWVKPHDNENSLRCNALEGRNAIHHSTFRIKASFFFYEYLLSLAQKFIGYWFRSEGSSTGSDESGQQTSYSFIKT